MTTNTSTTTTLTSIKYGAKRPQHNTNAAAAMKTPTGIPVHHRRRPPTQPVRTTKGQPPPPVPRSVARPPPASAFRTRVRAANRTAICTTTSGSVGRKTLRELLNPSQHPTTDASAAEAYRVPIFQRRYCWTAVQWDTIWNDALHRNSIKHSLGRLTCTHVVKDNTNNSHQEALARSVIVDGQQRFTTVTLILAAIRDALVELDGGITQQANHNQHPLLRSIHEMLFLDPAVMHAWAFGDENETSQGIPEGVRLEFCRLVPTFCDRSAYVAAVLPPDSPRVRDFVALEFRPGWHRPLAAKRHFADKIRALLLRACPESSPHQVLERLASSVLDGMDLLYFPIDIHRGYDDGTEDTMVVYERLALRDATWCKPSRPSEYQSMDGTDLVRNLLLGSLPSPRERVAFYETLWLPLERRLVPSGSAFASDETAGLAAVLRAFLDRAKHEEPRDPHRPVSSLSGGPGIIGGTIYRDFEEWMARDLGRWQQKQQQQQQQQQQQHRETDGIDTIDNHDECSNHTWDVGRRLLDFGRRHTAASSGSAAAIAQAQQGLAPKQNHGPSQTPPPKPIEIENVANNNTTR